MAVEFRKPLSIAFSKRVWKACTVTWYVFFLRYPCKCQLSVQVCPNIYSISMFTRASSFIRSNRRPRSTQPRVVCSCFRINSFSSHRHQNNLPNQLIKSLRKELPSLLADAGESSLRLHQLRCETAAKIGHLVSPHLQRHDQGAQ